MKLIVHIGTEKTGTSSIQESLFLNKTLLQKHGFYFSQSAGAKNNLSFPLASMLYSKGDPFFRRHNILTEDERQSFSESVKDKFYTEMEGLDNIHTVIISSEHFHSLLTEQQEVDNFRTLFCSLFDEIEVICYLREQVETCVSHYSTVIKSGRSPKLSEFIQKCTPENPYYNYLSLLDRWAATFGKDSLKLGVFNRLRLKNKDIVDDFFYKVSPSLLDLPIEKVREKNVSLNYIGQCLLKEINKRNDLSYRVNGRLIQLIHSQFSGKGENVSGKIYANTHNGFKELNRELKKKYFSNDQFLFPFSPPKNTNVIPNAEKIIKDIYPVVEYCLKQIVDDKYADVCRDSAVELESTDINKSYQLMKLAQIIRPHGRFINKKANEYKSMIDE